MKESGAENATLPHASFDVKFSTGILFGDDLAFQFADEKWKQCLHETKIQKKNKKSHRIAFLAKLSQVPKTLYLRMSE